MYCVVDSNDVTVAICSRKEDAAAWLNSNLDKENYRIKYLTSKE